MMSYQEEKSEGLGKESKSTMVKVNLCEDCAVKLNYKKYKDKMEKK